MSKSVVAPPENIAFTLSAATRWKRLAKAPSAKALAKEKAGAIYTTVNAAYTKSNMFVKLAANHWLATTAASTDGTFAVWSKLADGQGTPKLHTDAELAPLLAERVTTLRVTRAFAGKL